MDESRESRGSNHSFTGWGKSKKDGDKVSTRKSITAWSKTSLLSVKDMAVSSGQDLKNRRFYAGATLAEFIGTLLLVLVACGSTMQGGEEVHPATIRISLSFAFSVGSIVWIIGSVSGGHINPAVSVAYFVTRKMSIISFCLYIVAQVLGGIAGTAFLYLLRPSNYSGSLGSVALQDVSQLQGFVIEAVVTFILVLVYFSCSDKRRGDVEGSGPLQIGLAAGMCHLWALPLTGASMNPVRALGPAIFSSSLTPSHWVYWIGPFVGGILAGIMYEFVFAVNATPEKLKGFFSKDYDDLDYDASGKRSKPL